MLFSNKTQYFTKTSQQTRFLGKRLAEFLKTQGPLSKGARILVLQGRLGSGKTTFIQGLAQGFGIKEAIVSPTFILMRKFKIKTRSGKTGKTKARFKYFYHIDCYRFKNSKDLAVLRLQDIFSDPKNVVAIEWAERIADILPRDSFWLKFKLLGKNGRIITIKHNVSK
ncbi:MAG: tRNA (adenosine(37)-N6)-threonylcarbamoyltransferase complex ATPase subunit type 1 TsaE [Candidatus Paceibacteria bacterium]